LDMILLSLDEPQHADIEWKMSLTDEIERMFPFLERLELSFCSTASLLSSPSYARMRFMIKTQALCVRGDDIGLQLPPYRIGEGTIFHLRRLRKDLQIAINMFKERGSADRTVACRWICKALLRSALDVIMLKRPVYTRDLYLCYREFTQDYPASERILSDILHLALEPTDKTMVVIAAVEPASEVIFAALSQKERETLLGD
jgi:hypothetical protein